MQQHPVSRLSNPSMNENHKQQYKKLTDSQYSDKRVLLCDVAEDEDRSSLLNDGTIVPY